MPSHNLHQCWRFINWTLRNERKWNYDQNSCIFLKNVFWKMSAILFQFQCINTSRPRQNGCHFPDDIFKCIFLDEDIRIPIKISLKFVPKGLIDSIPALVQILAWRRPGDKPVFEPMMVGLPTLICFIMRHWVNIISQLYFSVKEWTVAWYCISKQHARISDK